MNDLIDRKLEADDNATIDAAQARYNREALGHEIRQELEQQHLPQWRREALHALLRRQYAQAGYTDRIVSSSGVLLNKLTSTP
jgi:hypothetical protein